MFKVYYGDGSTYQGQGEDDVDCVPTSNVQVIIQSSKEHGWQAMSDSHYYIWRFGRWWTVDMQGFGLFEYLLEPGWKKVLFGRTLPTEEYQKIIQQAMSDPDMPPKTGGPKRERKWARQ